MHFNVYRMAKYNIQYAVHVHTDKSLLELQVGIYHRSCRWTAFFWLDQSGINVCTKGMANLIRYHITYFLEFDSMVCICGLSYTIYLSSET